jgi:hypothetical protein
MKKSSKPAAADPARRQAVIYARVSSKEQEKEGFSIPAQLKLLKECAAANQDPIAARKAARNAEAGKPTFGDAAAALIAAKEHEWRARHSEYWRRTLETYTASLWNMQVDEVDTEAVLVPFNRSGRPSLKPRKGFAAGSKPS